MDLTGLIVSLAIGLGLGGLFFGGLWLSVRRLADVPAPGLWLPLGFVVRSGVVLAGFYLLAAGGWQRLLTGLLGFVLARILLTRWLAREGVRRGPES